MNAPPLVLLVDDVEDARDLYRTYLEFRGMRVICAEDGHQAIACALTHQPDLILMDLRMPYLTGAEAFARIRAYPHLRRVPIVALTAHAFENERQAALRVGFDAVLSKPCLPNERYDAIIAFLAQAKASN